MDFPETASPDPADSSPVSAAPPGSRRRRRRGKSRAAWWLWSAAALIVLGAGTVFGLQAWLRAYLRSPAFAEKINQTALSALHARGTMEELSWQDSTVHASQFRALGLEAASFRELTVSDARAEVDIGALWDRTWKVKRITLARVAADFSPERLSDPAASPASGSDSGTGENAPPSWLRRWLPNRAEMGPVSVDRFDFSWRHEGREIQGQQSTLTLNPNLREKFTSLSGSGGEVRLRGAEHPLRIRTFQGTLRGEALSLEEFQGEIAGAALQAEGTLAIGQQRDLSLKLSLDQARLEDWIPEDWLRRCSGGLSLDAKVRAGGAGFSRISADGKVRLKEALVQALPLLDVIAKKTRNETFLRLQLKEAESAFTRMPDGAWRLDRLRADAPGLLRLKGSATLDAAGALNGEMLLGIVPGTLRYLAGAEQGVFLPMDKAGFSAPERALLSSDDSGLLWTRLRLRGTLESPAEDLSDRLAKAWFNATAAEVANLSMEAAAKAAETASGAAGALLDAAPPVLPPVLNQAPGLLKEGVQGGLNVLDGLLPR